jgi:hypothetical protein
MRSSFFTHLVWALLVVVAFSIGRFIDDHPSGAGADPSLHKSAGTGTGPSGSTAPSASQVTSSASQRETSGLPAVLSPEQVRTVTFELLREPKRIERLSRLCELLRRITPENWREVMDAFTRQTAFEGREHGEEWKLMLHRVGEVAGPDGVLDALNSNGVNRDHRARNTLEGWAMANPDAALAWLQAQSPEHQQILIPAMLYGLARSSPVQGLDFALAQKNPETRDGAIPDIVNGAVQQGGFRKGEELLASVMNRPDIDETVKSKLFYELARKRLIMARLRDIPMESLQWLDGYLGERSPAGPNAVKEIIASAAATDPSAAIQWLDQRAERLTPAQSIPGYTAALQAVYKQSPQQFITWLTVNQSHPAHDILVEGYANDLIASGRTTEAGEWMNTVQNGTTRQRIQAALEKYARKNAKQP